MIQCKRGVGDPQQQRRLSGAGRPSLAAGMQKEALACDEWCGELTPSAELRKVFTARHRFRPLQPALSSGARRPSRNGPALAALAQRQPLTLYAAEEHRRTCLVLAAWLAVLPGYDEAMILAPQRPPVEGFLAAAFALGAGRLVAFAQARAAGLLTVYRRGRRWVFAGAVGCGWAQPANTSGRIASNLAVLLS